MDIKAKDIKVGDYIFLKPCIVCKVCRIKEAEFITDVLMFTLKFTSITEREFNHYAYNESFLELIPEESLETYKVLYGH